MLQYPDLKLNDVIYYWQGSILLRKSGSQFLPCRLGRINGDSKYPIELIDMSTGEKHINLRLETFKHTVLIHHPSLGYGDYKGIPVYLSPVAGREKRKGLNIDNITAMCPVNWEASILKMLSKITEDSRAFLKSTGRVTLPSEITNEYTRLRSLVNEGGRSRAGDRMLEMVSGRARRRNNDPSGRVRIRDDKMWASVIAQSVNNNYPSIDEAIEQLQNDGVMGVSVSRDFALVKTQKVKVANVYHRMSLVAKLNTSTGEIVYASKLSKVAAEILDLAINKLRRQ